MKNKILLCFLLFSFKSFGQIIPEWVAVYDSSSSHRFVEYQMKVSPVGNVYVVGSTWNTNPLVNVLVKYNTNGNLIWFQTQDSIITNPGDMTIDDAENIYITGRYLNQGWKFLTMKYDSSGNLLWAVPYYYCTSNGFNYPFAIAVDDSGNVYVTGESCNEISTIKYNSSGTLQWDEHYNALRARDLIVDSMNNVYVTGNANDSLGFSVLTLKYDLNGNLLWDAKYQEAYGVGDIIKMDNAGNLFVGGTIENGNGQGKFKLLKYDNLGNFIWDAEYDPGFGHNGPRDMIIDSYSNIYMTGTQNSGSGFGENYGTVKFDSTGQLIWVKIDDGGYQDNSYGIVSDNVGNVYVTGMSSYEHVTIKYDSNGDTLWTAFYSGSLYSTSSIAIDGAENIYISGSIDLPFIGNNILTLKYGNTTDIHENNFSNQVIISPNPATTEFQISNFEFHQGDEIILTDVLGKTLFTKTISAPTLNFKLKTSNFSNGIYFLQLKTKEWLMSKKVVVQH